MIKYVRNLKRYILARKHPLTKYVEMGTIHPSAIYPKARFAIPLGSRILIGEHSIFNGELIMFENALYQMGSRSYVGEGTKFYVTESVTLGDDVMISWDCTLLDTSMHSLNFHERSLDVLITGGYKGYSYRDKDRSAVESGPIYIQNKVWIGLRSIILCGVTLGEGCVIGAGSVVTRNIPPWTLAAGNPAKVIRSLK